MATQNQDIRSRAHRSTTIATLALALAGIVTPAAAANFQYRHLAYGLTAPVSAPPQAQQAAAEIVVALTGAPSLPAGEVNASYRYDLKQLLTVTGESWSASNVSWSLPVGALPAGLSLGTDGVISGIPTTKDLVGSSFQVKASYKGKDGQQVYTIVVNGAVLHVTQISAGTSNTCAVTTSGGAVCWGNNSFGQLGNNSTANSLVPVPVSGLDSVASISVGGYHVCALTTSNNVKCWGRNDYGQLGDSSTAQRNAPVSVYQQGVAISSISAGLTHTCAVTTAGAALCWGMNSNGQVGDGSSINQLKPVAVSGLTSGVTSISAGHSHTCATTDSGSAKCWGQNGSYGMLGNNSTSDNPRPVQVTGLTAGAVRVSAGTYHTCAITTGGVKCWGFNAYGQLGNNTTVTSGSPVVVSGLSAGVSSIATGYAHSCAVTAAGAAVCWGYNTYGQIGDNTSANRTVPTTVSGLSAGVTAVTSGNGQSCALTAAGPMCWGRNDGGQLGDNSTTFRATPVSVSPQ